MGGNITNRINKNIIIVVIIVVAFLFILNQRPVNQAVDFPAILECQPASYYNDCENIFVIWSHEAANIELKAYGATEVLGRACEPNEYYICVDDGETEGNEQICADSNPEVAVFDTLLNTCTCIPNLECAADTCRGDVCIGNCGVTYGGTKFCSECPVPGDTLPCDNALSRGELGGAISAWINGDMDRNDLGIAIENWVFNG